MKHAKTKHISIVDSRVLRLFVGLALVVGLMPSISFAEQETVTVRDSEGAVEEVVVEQVAPPVDTIGVTEEGDGLSEHVAASPELKTEPTAETVFAARAEGGLSEETVLVTSEGEAAENDAKIEISLTSAPKTESGIDYYNDSVSVGVTIADADFASGTVKAMRNGSAVKTEVISSIESPTTLSLASSDTEEGAVTIEVEVKDESGAVKTYSYGPDSDDGTCTTKADGNAVSNSKIAVNAVPQVTVSWATKGIGSVNGETALFPGTASADTDGVVATITVTDKTLFGTPADSVEITAAEATLGDWSGADGVYSCEVSFAYEAGKAVSVSATAKDAGELSGAGAGSITMTADSDSPKLNVEYYVGSNSTTKTALFSGVDAGATNDSVTVELTVTEANPLNAGNIVVDFGDGTTVDLSTVTQSDSKYVLTHTYSADGRFPITVTGSNSMGGACDVAGNPLTDSGASSGKYRATVAVDKQKPSVESVEYYTGYGTDSAKNLAAVDGEYSANGQITAKVSVKDVSFDAEETIITITGGGTIKLQGGKTWAAQDDGVTYVALVEFPASDESRNEYELSFVAKDKLNQETAYPETGTDKIVVDTTTPKLTVDFPAEAQDYESKADKGEVRYYNGSADVVATVTVEDDAIDVEDIIVSAEGATLGDWDATDSKKPTRTVTFPQPAEGADVTYDLTVTGKDKYGNQIRSGAESTYVDTSSDPHQYATKVVLDRKLPVLTVAWDNEDVVNGRYYKAARTATITVEDASFDANLIEIDGETVSSEKWSAEGSSYTYTKAYSDDGAYALTVKGEDRVGLALTGADGTDVSNQGKYESSFVVDTKAPVVTLKTSQPPSNSASGVDYYRAGTRLDVAVEVEDANFDPAADAAHETVITPTGTFAESYDKNNWSGASYTVTFTPNDAYGAAPSNTLTAIAYDLAGNSTTVAYGDVASSGNANFTLDVTAPVIVPGNGSDVPNRVYSGNYSDTLVFYKDATTLRIIVNDAIGIDSITGEGSDYSFDAVSGKSGDKSWTMDVSLRDGKEFTDEFLLTATDLAQNVRMWKISPKTLDVQDAIGSSAANLPLYGDEQNLYPVALILDTTAPSISLSGATPGAYYNSTQAITTAVEELNFKYLKQYDGSQVITTVTKKAGNATRAATTTTIPVSGFTGGESSYSNVFQAAEDGHYSFAAHITDPAGNEASASLGEFTVDKTAPVASISWDNTDVRNDKYYAAARTATITVVEHNFDASRISIATTGSVGAWMDNGDTHTIQVSFGSDGTYNLSVTGTDLAGNALNEITEPEFVVDMTVPNIEISVVENGYAYGKDVAVAPVITFTDEANFDPNGTSYTLTGSKNGEVSYSAGLADSDNSRTVTYGDFGADRGGSYDPNADDIYTLHATMTDLAGNAAAEQTVTFSVNRYGSTYRILEGDYTKENAYLDEAPEVRIQEINVSGTVPEKNSIVVSPEGASQKYLTMNAAVAPTGYTVTESTSTEGASRGWSTYTYSIAPGNFDHDARYHVVVTSEDRAANRNTSTGYFNRDKSESDAKAEVVFILDENAPEVVGLHVTGGELDEYYEGEFSVHEDIGIASVEVTLAGESLEVEDLGGNNYAFKAPSRSFAPSRELVVTATDLSDKSGSDEIDLTSLLIALPIGVVVVVGVAAFFVVRAVRRPRVRVK